MDRKVKSFRLRTDLLDWLKGYAASRETTEIAVMEAALVSFKADAQSGVPDLEVVAPAPSREQQEANKAALKAARLDSAAKTAPGMIFYADSMIERQHRLNAAAARARAPKGKKS